MGHRDRESAVLEVGAASRDVVGTRSGELGPLLDRGPDPAVEPLRRRARAWSGTEPPRARSHLDPRPQGAEGVDGRPRGIRPEQGATRRGAALVVVERGGQHGIQGVLGVSRTPPVTDRVSSTGQAASTQDRTTRSSSSAVSMSSRAEAVTSDAPARSSGPSRVRSPCRVSTVTAAPSAPATGRVARGDARAGRRRGRGAPSAAVRRSAGRATGPSSPLPQPRSCTTVGAAPSRSPAALRARSVERAAASAGSRSRSHCELTRTSTAVTQGTRAARARAVQVGGRPHPRVDRRRAPPQPGDRGGPDPQRPPRAGPARVGGSTRLTTRLNVRASGSEGWVARTSRWV